MLVLASRYSHSVQRRLEESDFRSRRSDSRTRCKTVLCQSVVPVKAGCCQNRRTPRCCRRSGQIPAELSAQTDTRTSCVLGATWHSQERWQLSALRIALESYSGTCLPWLLVPIDDHRLHGRELCANVVLVRRSLNCRTKRICSSDVHSCRC